MVLKRSGNKKPDKKAKYIKCKDCRTKFQDSEDNTERINGTLVYICPECGYETV